MENFNLLIETVAKLSAQNEKYIAKPTKAETKRMRASIAGIQKLAVAAKRDLIAADEKM